MKKQFLFVLLFMLALGVASAADISTCAQLRDMDLTTANVLINNIDCTGVTWATSATPMSGSLDGQGFTVSNLDIIGIEGPGMFDQLTGSITNLNILNINKTNCGCANDNDVGGLVRYLNGGLIENVTLQGSVAGQGNTGVGGLVGYGWGTIRNVGTDVDVVVLQHGAGLIGSVSGGATEISNSYATGTVQCGGNICAGFAGILLGNAVIHDCYANTVVTNGDAFIENAGFVAYVQNANQIYNSYSTGSVTGRGGITAGFLGIDLGGGTPSNYTNTFTSIFVVGVADNSTTAAWGTIQPDTIYDNTHYYSNRAGCVYIFPAAFPTDVGCVKINDSTYFYSAANLPLSNWDFTTTWDQYSNKLPHLQWENFPGCGDAVCNDGETCATCAADCGVCKTGGGGPSFECGDGVCDDPYENEIGCPQDCAPPPVEIIEPPVEQAPIFSFFGGESFNFIELVREIFEILKTKTQESLKNPAAVVVLVGGIGGIIFLANQQGMFKKGKKGGKRKASKK